MSGKADFRSGRKAMVVDIFGEWFPFNHLPLKDVAHVEMPPVLVSLSDILQWNIELEEGKIPYTVLDSLRMQNGIDVTALSVSQTANGNVYQSYVLMNIPSR